MSWCKVEQCIGCNREITGQVPVVNCGDSKICGSCALDLLEPIYRLSGVGAVQHILFARLLADPHNRKKRVPIKQYRKIFDDLLHKYKFSCVFCGAKDRLTIDHIVPVAKGGGDEFSNLQILCRSCNSKKGAKHAVV